MLKISINTKVFNSMFSFLGFNNLSTILLSSLLLQVLMFEMVLYFSYFYFIVLELWIFFLITFFKPSSFNTTFLIFLFVVSFFTSFLVSVLLLSESNDLTVLLFLFVCFKVLLIVFIVVFSINDSNSSFNFLLIIYVFNFKIFLVLFVCLVFNDLESSEKLLGFVLDTGFLFVGVWLFLFFVLVWVLVLDGLESYFLVILSFSHYIIFFSCFLSVNLFLFCSILDCFMGFLIAQLIYFNYHFLFYSSASLYSSLFFFVLVCYSFGVPPYPSFLLELCLFFVIYNSVGNFIGFIFLIIFYCLVSLNFIFIFGFLGSVVNNSYSHGLIWDKSFLILVLFLCSFLFSFINMFLVFYL